MRIPVLQHGAHLYLIFISEFQPARNRMHSLSLRHGKGVGGGYFFAMFARVLPFSRRVVLSGIFSLVEAWTLGNKQVDIIETKTYFLYRHPAEAKVFQGSNGT